LLLIIDLENDLFFFIDSTMVTSRVTVHFDDLLSVVNDAQLKSALNTYKEVTQLMKRASEQRKRKAGDKLTVCILEKML
jgi:hypothetical protein